MLATLLFDFGAGLEPFRVEVLGTHHGRYVGRPVDVRGEDILFDEKDVAWVESGRVRMSGMFDAWAKKEEEEEEPRPSSFFEPVTPPPEKARIEPGERPPVLYLPYTPGGIIPAVSTETPLAQFKREEPPALPAKYTPFEVFRPGTQKPVSQEGGSGMFSVWKPPPGQEPIVAPAPAPSGEPSLFSSWNPEVAAAEAAAMKERPLWEAMVPVEERGSIYRPETEIFQPPAPPPEAPRPRRKKEPEPVRWTPPSVEWMARTLGEALDLGKVWKLIRKDRKEDWFKEYQAEAEEGLGEGPVPIPIQTTINYEEGNVGHWTEELFNFLDLEAAPIKPLLDRYYKDEDEEANEELNEIGYELKELISDAFETLKPDDLPGTFGIYDHPNYGNQEFIGYIEDPADTLTPEERRRAQLEREREEQKALEKAERRAKKFLGGWSVPSWEDMAQFLDVNFNLPALVENIRKARTRKKWRDELRESGSAQFVVINFGTDDGELEFRLAEMFGIPSVVIDRFAHEDDFQGLWDLALYPIFERIEEAWENVKPLDIPGKLLATEDQSDEFVLYYEEEADYTEEEE